MADSGKNLDTGDNGFPIDGTKQTFDVGVPDAQAQTNGKPGYGTFKKGVDVSAGFLDDNGKPKDLSVPTKTTLAAYLSNLTMGKQQVNDSSDQPPTVANVYPVQPGNGVVHLTDDKGFPALLEAVPANPGFATGAEATFDYPTKQYPAISSLIKKGLSSVKAVDGHDLLAGVTGNSTSVASDPTKLIGDAPLKLQPSVNPHGDTSAKIINPYTSAVMSNNRFTGAAAAFAQVPDVSDPGSGFDPALTVQGKLGEWVPGAPTYTVGRLATIGPLLGLRATTTLGATSPGTDPSSGGMEAAALLPGLAQLGSSRIDQHVLLAKDILNSLTTDEAPSSNVISPGSLSWGQLNDTNDPYSGTNALGMVTLTLALVAGIQIIIGALGVLLGLVTPQTKVAQRDSLGRYAIGQYFPTSKPPNAVSGGGPLGAISALASLNFGALLGINPTVYPLSQAMNSGLAAFYGLPQPSGGPGISFSIGLSTATDSPGFLVTVSRSIIRGFVIIGDSLSKIGGNPMNVINAILSMIDTIRSSKVVSAINVWAMLGDQILTLPASDTNKSAAGGTKISNEDQLANTLTNAVGRSRLSNTLKLAWASNRARANLLMPGTIAAASVNVSGLGAWDHVVGIKQDPYSNVQTTTVDPTDNGRIDSDTASQFEATLDAEYVPFYFHDVRTNEMVAFHAFLTSLTDDFSAAYEKTEGYGRAEPIRVYKSTERRINVSFYIAATSEPDFDEMWLKINKLVTLVYPQYTQGVQLSNGSSYTFTQPFSQLIGAAPLVRLRLGNLLSSNYSRFALARLFGLGNANFKINSYTSTDSLDADTMAKFPGALATALANPDGESYFVAPGAYPLMPDNSGGISISIGPPAGPSNAPLFMPQSARIADTFMVTAVKLLNDPPSSPDADPGPIICIPKVNDDPQFAATYPDLVADAATEYGNSDKLIRNVLGAKYIIPANALIPTPQTKASIVNKIKPPVTSGASDLSDFMAATKGGTTNNAITKSFEDVGGKGLAGFIDTMNFDWYDKVTWELHQNRVAPKLCKVTLTFSPIHDISPGIDHQGYNRAPVYPVGPFAPSYTPPSST